MSETSSNSKFYCVFWYPTIFHKEKQRRLQEHTRGPIDISDNSGSPLYLWIEEIAHDFSRSKKDSPKDCDCYDLRFTFRKDNREDDNEKAKVLFSVDFVYEKHSRNGFVVYSYDREKLLSDYQRIGNACDTENSSNQETTLCDEDMQDGLDRILINCYHHSKDFYHRHEILPDSDGRLEAFFYLEDCDSGKRTYLNKEPDLDARNNDVINCYIDQFEKQFSRYAEGISKLYNGFSRQVCDFQNDDNCFHELSEKKDEKSLREFLIEAEWKEKTSLELDASIKESDEDFDFVSFRGKEEKRLESKNFQELKDETEKFFNKQYIDGSIKRIREGLFAIERSCSNAETEYTYCQTLLGSKYNNHYNPKAHIKLYENSDLGTEEEKEKKALNEIRDKRRKKAFNIENCIGYIRGVRWKCLSWSNSLNYQLEKSTFEVTDSAAQLVKSSKTMLDVLEKSSERNDAMLNELKKSSKRNDAMLNELKKSSKLSSFLAIVSVVLGLIGAYSVFRDILLRLLQK